MISSLFKIESQVGKMIIKLEEGHYHLQLTKIVLSYSYQLWSLTNKLKLPISSALKHLAQCVKHGKETTC